MFWSVSLRMFHSNRIFDSRNSSGTEYALSLLRVLSISLDGPNINKAMHANQELNAKLKRNSWILVTFMCLLPHSSVWVKDTSFCLLISGYNISSRKTQNGSVFKDRVLVDIQLGHSARSKLINEGLQRVHYFYVNWIPACENL